MGRIAGIKYEDTQVEPQESVAQLIAVVGKYGVMNFSIFNDRNTRQPLGVRMVVHDAGVLVPEWSNPIMGRWPLGSSANGRCPATS